MKLLKIDRPNNNRRYRLTVHSLKYNQDTKKMTGSLTVESHDTFIQPFLEDRHRDIIDLEIDLNLTEYPAGYYRGVVNSKSTTNIVVELMDYFQFYDRKSVERAAMRANGPYAATIFRMCIHENIDDSIILLNNAHGKIDLENIEEEIFIPTDEPDNAAIYNRDPVFRKMWHSFLNKRAMLLKLDTRDTISYLEAQVDLLTRLLLRYSTIGEGTDLRALLSLADTASVLDIKEQEKIVKEFTKNKMLVRDAQLEFYENEKSNQK